MCVETYDKIAPQSQYVNMIWQEEYAIKVCDEDMYFLFDGWAYFFFVVVFLEYGNNGWMHVKYIFFGYFISNAKPL